ncbi:programmed cell death protein 1 [Notechis scutatus]|uniref:Programmed cell death protein 1 n=1 Tax=Notechis scutatus TaxID=8663 RepID=A0A6J1VTF6_9SAUR|nr:programmed cell death protein 1 [Notechis scutatus]
MENVFHVLWGFLFFPSALLDKPFVRFHPPQLNLTEGETAKFTCSISNPDFGKHLNWYKQGHDRQPIKLDGSNRKYSFSKGDKCMMEIRQVEKNDSGTYYCWVNPFHPEGTILESNRGNLTVTEKAVATQPPDEITPVKEQDDGDRKDAKSSFSDLRGNF